MLPRRQQHEDSSLCTFELTLAPADKVMTMSAANDANLWRRRMGHLNAQILQIFNNTADNSLEYSRMFSLCDIYSVKKSKQRNHPKKANHGVDAPPTLVFTDLIRLISPPTIGGHPYFSKFSDEFTKWKEAYLITSKSEAVETRRLFVQSLTIPMGLRVQRLCSDRGTEYKAGKQHGLDKGIRP